MTYKDAVLNGLDEFLQGLKKAVDGLTAEELRFQASPTSNHITWLVWHMARVEDSWLTRVSGTDSVWDTGGWAAKTGLTGEEYQRGNSRTIEEVTAMPEVPVATLLSYYEAVRARTLGVLDGMTDADMAKTQDNTYRGTTTNAWIFGHIIVEESQHLGQIAFIRGMQRGLGG
jgi:uncharacterized damage-inducible protein DinB